MNEQLAVYKMHFIDLMIKAKALKFGDFTLKSGRKSPFFVNLGAFQTGFYLRELARCYAEAIKSTYGLQFDALFGPAYKGIPLSVATAMLMDELYKTQIRYSANRKEEKDHGDAGIFLGANLSEGDRVVIIEDVTTSGASMRETVPILQSRGVNIVGLMISLNRNEFGTRADMTALEEVSREFGFPATAIVSMPEVIDYLTETGYLTATSLTALERYYDQYGVKK